MSKKYDPQMPFGKRAQRPEDIAPGLDTPQAWPRGANAPNILAVHDGKRVQMRARTIKEPQSHMHYEVGFSDGIDNTTLIVCRHNIDACIEFMQRLKDQMAKEDAALEKVRSIRVAQREAPVATPKPEELAIAISIVAADKTTAINGFDGAQLGTAIDRERVVASLSTFDPEAVTYEQYRDAMNLLSDMMGAQSIQLLAEIGELHRRSKGLPPRNWLAN